MYTPTHDVNLNITPSTERSTLTAVYPTRAAARSAINDLHAFGLRDDQIGVAMREPQKQDQLIADTGTHATEGADNGVQRRRKGLRDLMTDLRVIFFPRQPRPVLAPAVARIGGVIGALMNMQIPEAEARQRASVFQKGSVLISAKVYDVVEAQRVMQLNGGGMVNRAEQPAADVA